MQIDLIFPGGDFAEPVTIEVVGEDHFRLLEGAPIFGFDAGDAEEEDLPGFDDVFQATKQENGEFLFLRVIKRSALKRCRLHVSKSIAESVELRSILDQAARLGGYWERTMGGILDLYFPPQILLDVERQIENLAKQNLEGT
jgi:hypothetical protein